MPAEPEDAVPAGYEAAPGSEQKPEPEPKSAGVANTTGKMADYLFLTTLGAPWAAVGIWLESGSQYSGWVSLLIAGGGVVGLSGFLGDDAAALPLLGGGLLGLGAYVYGIVTSDDAIRMLFFLGLWTAASYLILGSAIVAVGPKQAQDPGSAAEAPAEPPEPSEPPEPQDRDVPRAAD